MAGLAQMVERFTCNEDVVGSIPTTGSNFYLKSYKEKAWKKNITTRRLTLVIWKI